MAVGAIWDRQTIHAHRRDEMPVMGRIVVAVDPAVSAETGSDEHGITVQGIGQDGRGYLLDDLTKRGTPQQWAERAIAAFDRYDADAIVIERNQGGDMVRHTVASVRPGVPIVEVTATRGKHVRAEPISALYSMGRISHVGTFPELEDQMCLMTASGYEGPGSPDRLDAMVWGFTELFPTISRGAFKAMPVNQSISGDWML
jgi:phage terminase large subunit-like protein